MFCSNVIKYTSPVKPQGNGVMRDERAPSLDVRDVEDEDCRRQHGGHPDESGIGGLVHGVLHKKIMCQTPHGVFNFLNCVRK